MNCLVTGGAGFIGSHLVTELVHEGHTVVVLDNISTGSKQNLAAVAREIKFIEGDIRDEKVVTTAAAGTDVVFHLAALGSVPRSVKEPLVVNEHNVTGTLAVLIGAREAEVRRVVFSSSSSVYGLIKEAKQVETIPPQPASPYAASKLAGEHYVRLAGELYGLETVSLRYFNVFGPRQDPNSDYAAVIPLFIRQLLEGHPVRIHGDGEQRRDFTYVKNVVSANIAASQATLSQPGACFNIATGKSVSVNEMYQELQGLLGLTLQATHGPARVGDIRFSHADITRAKEHLDWHPTVSFSDGLAETVAWHQQNEPVGARM